MESLTKRILAIVLIAVIGVGIGVGAWIFLSNPSAKIKYPGAPSGFNKDNTIIIGCLGDSGDITGEGNYDGAYLAVKQINEAGGVVINSTTFYYGIVSENTYEAEPQLDISKGTLAAEKLITQYNPNFVVGGFRTEAAMAYREPVVAAKKVFINTGAATDSFCASVGANYSKYKYLFRTMPINSSSLAKEIVEFYVFAVKPALEAALGVPVTNIGIIREDLAWTVPMSYILNGYYIAYGYYGLNNNPWFNFTIVEEVAYPITATSTDFTGYLNTMTSSGVQVLCPIISAQGGIKMMTQYNSLQPDYMVVGIDVMSQLGDDPDDPKGYWHDTGGGCKYEIIMQTTTRTNKTTQTIAFWDDYTDYYGVDPLYTAVGAYGAVKMLHWAVDQTKSINSNDIVTQLETIDKSNPFVGPGGNVAFNQFHDLIEGYNPVTKFIYSTTLWVQWLANGTKAVVTSNNVLYPQWIVDAPIEVPPWI